MAFSGDRTKLSLFHRLPRTRGTFQRISIGSPAAQSVIVSAYPFRAGTSLVIPEPSNSQKLGRSIQTQVPNNAARLPRTDSGCSEFQC